jgi:hypothetical protein
MSSYSASAGLAALIKTHAVDHARHLIAAQLAADAELAARYGERERQKAIEDASYTLEVLAEAFANDDPGTFARHITWLDGILRRVGLPRTDLGRHLVLLREHLLKGLPAEFSGQIHAFLDPVVDTIAPTEGVTT